MKAHLLADLNSVQLSSAVILVRHCVKGMIYLLRSLLHSEFFFPVIFLFQSVLSFLSFPQALLLNLKVVNNILAISGSLIKMVLILTVTRIKISLSHRFLSLILQPQKQKTVIRKDMTA